MNKTTLYRPVGQKEMDLIETSEMKAFPPRLEWQPIFYPVLNIEYACQIAQRWNTEDEFSGYVSYVLSFNIPTEYYEKFEVQNVGGFEHNELWVPAEELDEFNKKIIDKIKLEKTFYGDKYSEKI